jgi:hypothetical protein
MEATTEAIMETVMDTVMDMEVKIDWIPHNFQSFVRLTIVAIYVI